jgi:S-adenosyl-L-methionine methyltransferase
MSRLDSFIRRMQAQRLVLNHAAAALGDLPGSVLELGLGNGRTYDHLREVIALPFRVPVPARRIIAFDRANVANPTWSSVRSRKPVPPSRKCTDRPPPLSTPTSATGSPTTT